MPAVETEDTILNLRDLVVKPATVSDRSLTVVGLDLATTTGYAFRTHDRVTGEPTGPLYLGLWDLSAGQYDSGAIRFARLRRFLLELNPSLVLMEDAKVQMSDLGGPKFRVHALMLTALKSSELFGALKGTVAAWCEEFGVPCQSYNVKAIKKFATGKGNASKEDMIHACNAKFESTLVAKEDGTDNAADAAFIYQMGVEQVLPGLLSPRGGVPCSSPTS